MAPSASSLRRLHRERLVVIVLADQHDASGPSRASQHRLVVLHAQVRRLLDQHVLAGGQRPQRQVEVKARAARR